MLPKVFNPPPQDTKKGFPRFLKIILIFLIILALLIYFLFFSSFFKISQVTCKGLSLEDEDLAKIKGQNILLFRSGQLKKEISAKYPYISDVRVVKGLPETLKIIITQYQPAMIWQSSGNLYLVNEKGFVFNEVSGETDLPIVKDTKDLPVEPGQQVTSVNLIDFVRQLTYRFPEVVGFKIAYFEIEETIFQINALTERGWLIKFETTREAEDQLEDLKQFLAEHEAEVSQYIDVRVEGKVFFK